MYLERRGFYLAMIKLDKVIFLTEVNFICLKNLNEKKNLFKHSLIQSFTKKIIRIRVILKR